MKIRSAPLHLIAGVLAAVVALQASVAGTWTGTLPDGSRMQVDPETRRAVRIGEDGARTMWDGAHRLQDGSVVIVRDGQAVPSQSMMDAWSAEPGSEPTLRERWCEQLVRKTCGFNGECGQSGPCVRAEQLLRTEREEQRRAPLGAGMYPQTPASDQCARALGDAAFAACAAAPAVLRESACQALVQRVCGADDRCAGSPACNPARQLLRMETEERLESADAAARTSTGVECERALRNAFFKACD